MSIRLIALYIMVAGVCVYAWKDWFKSLCGLILIMAIIHHEDMPTNMFGIQGFNVWNIMFVSILLAWAANRHRQESIWDMPRHVSVLLLLYLGVIVMGVLRAVFDRSHIEAYPLKDMMSEELINTIKWVLPGILLFDGCRTRRRVVMALVCLLAVYFLLSVQVVKRMPWGSALAGDDREMQHTRLSICEDIGYSSCDMSTILAGATWGMLAALPLARKKQRQLMVLAAAGVIAFGQALTGGRAGYVAWGATGLVLCLLKWRKQLLLAPVLMILLPILLPGATQRMLYGFGQTDASGQATRDDYEVTSGRNLIWPHVIAKIGQSPVIGYGRLAMERTGLTQFLGQTYGEAEAFPHPHNMYLETLLDNGLLGSIPIWLFWGTIVLYATRLFRSDNRLCSAIGGLSLGLTVAELVAGMGAQHFYPRESTFCMWVAMFLMLRVYVEEHRLRTAVMGVEGSRNSQTLEPHVVATPVGAWR
jgi:O-antigen ligase